MIDCRLLIDPPAPGDWNMAVDEMLLEWAASNNRSCWRFYQWSEPTLSLGYFQTYEDRQSHVASRQCPVVRRASGGGAILHDAEVTYSIVVPASARLARNRRSLYDAVHNSLIEVLKQLGVQATLCEGCSGSPCEAKSFLCFLRRSPGDVLVEQTKIAGSAQRRNQGAVLQHGSVLLRRSTAAPELDGLDRFLSGGLDAHRLIQLWLPSLANHLQLNCYQLPVSPDERHCAETLVAAKYGADNWTRKRGRSKSN